MMDERLVGHEGYVNLCSLTEASGVTLVLYEGLCFVIILPLFFYCFVLSHTQFQVNGVTGN